MRLSAALEQISEIRHAMARAAVFRGFRSSTVLFSALAAVGAAAAQGIFVSNPQRDIDGFLIVWFAVATTALGVIAGGAAWRLRHASGPLQRDLAASALGQFLPTLLAGAG